MTSEPYSPPSASLGGPQEPEAKPRRWWIAGLLGWAMTGLGQVYVGRAARGIAGFFFVIVLIFGAGAMLIWGPSPRLGLALFLIPLGLALYLVVDAILTARRSGAGYRLKRYNRWYVYPILFVLARGILLVVLWFWREDFAQSFHIPSGSMEPTMLRGDHVYIDKRAYGARDPERGELVVFSSPERLDVVMVSRAVGLPGDRLEIRAKAVFLDGKRLPEPYAVHNDPVTYSSTTFSPQGRQRDHASVTVPEGHYFVMGDNRDKSYDSRFYGAVPRENILGGGRVVVYWSRDLDTGEVRWDRIGKILAP